MKWWKKSVLAAKRFGEHIIIVKVIKPDTPPGQTELKIIMNIMDRRFQHGIEIVFLVVLVDTNRVVEVRTSPTTRGKMLSYNE